MTYAEDSSPKQIQVRCDAETFLCKKDALRKASPYFGAMFSGNFAESMSESVEIKGVDATSMGMLIEYVSKGRLDTTNLDLDGLISLAQAASMLQFESAAKICVRGFLRLLSPESCLGLMEIGEDLGLMELKRKARSFFLHRFSTARRSSTFLSLTMEEVMSLLSSDGLNPTTEEEVFDSIVEWKKKNAKRNMRRIQRLSEKASATKASSTESSSTKSSATKSSSTKASAKASSTESSATKASTTKSSSKSSAKSSSAESSSTKTSSTKLSKTSAGETRRGLQWVSPKNRIFGAWREKKKMSFSGNLKNLKHHLKQVPRRIPRGWKVDSPDSNAIEEDQGARKVQLLQLLTCIRYYSMDPKIIASVILQHPLIRENHEATVLLYQILKHLFAQLTKEYGPKNPALDSPEADLVFGESSSSALSSSPSPQNGITERLIEDMCPERLVRNNPRYSCEALCVLATIRKGPLEADLQGANRWKSSSACFRYMYSPYDVVALRLDFHGGPETEGELGLELVPFLRMKHQVQGFDGQELLGYEVCALGDKVMVFGGELNIGRSNWNVTVSAFDVITEEWRYDTSLPKPRRHHRVVADGEDVYLIGGYGKHRMPLSEIHKYNSKEGTWSVCSKDLLLVIPNQFVACMFQGRLHVITPSDCLSFKPLVNDDDEFIDNQVPSFIIGGDFVQMLKQFFNMSVDLQQRFLVLRVFLK
ncbi:unnamed protein product [Cyprideis torosa]|uniref:Uncharacterized protein n=1 Tax=Cyprideis torosa TaxID=163714 RepID=A0A7R8W8M5_9CRUS|nr:unnamed protein product [Cyprideis torosa]CAG0884472.1 unnamed protein product [Cyprideis torosa]